MVFDFKSAVKNMAQEEQEKAVEKDNTINFQKFKTEESTNAEQAQTQNMGIVETAQDMGVSGSQGLAKGLTYTIDLPFYLGQALNTGKGVIVDFVGNAIGLNEDEIDQAKKEMLVLSKGEAKFPGELIRENFLKYNPKTTPGKYTEAAAEFAVPGGVFAKGYKAKKLFMGTGGVSGLAEQGASDLSGSDMLGAGVGVGLNIGLDLLALKKGNFNVIAKDILPDSDTIAKAKEIQKNAKKYGLNLKTSEVTGDTAIKSTEANISAYISGSKVIDKHWQKRPTELKKYINNWAKSEGFVKTNKLKTDTALYEDLKKAAIKLSNRRTEAWEKAGGAKIINFNYDSQLTNNLAIKFEEIAKNQTGSLKNEILGFVNKINKSKGNGQILHNVYKELRDMNLNITKNPSASNADRLLAKDYKKLANEVENLLSTNNNFKKAQKKYKDFTEVYVQPIEDLKLSVFKNINSAGWEKKPENIAKLFRVLSSNTIEPKDIIRFANSWKKSGDVKVWKDLTSNFFQSKFNDALADPKGTNVGMKLYTSIMGTPRQKANFTEMLYQLAKYDNPKIQKKAIEKSVNSFANVLKATGEKVSIGSPTAQRQYFQETASKGFVSELLKFPPGLKAIDNWLTDREFSKVSKELADAMVSEKGITALELLAQNWKDKNAAVAYLRAITIGSSEIE